MKRIIVAILLFPFLFAYTSCVLVDEYYREWDDDDDYRYRFPNTHIGLEAGVFSAQEKDLDTGYEIGGKFQKYANEEAYGIILLSSYRESDTNKYNFKVSTVSFGVGPAIRMYGGGRFIYTIDGGILYNMNTIKLDGVRDDGSTFEYFNDSTFGYFVDAGGKFMLTRRGIIEMNVRYHINDQSTSWHSYKLGGVSVLLGFGMRF